MANVEFDAKLDRKGRVTMPAEVRRALRLEDGDMLVYREDGTGRVAVSRKAKSTVAAEGIRPDA